MNGTYLLKKRIKKILPTPVRNFYYALFPFFGNIIYRNPSNKIKIIGVTGTDGKSSTVIFLAKILKDAGYKVGHFSSVFYSDGNTEKVNGFKMTMPGRFFLQKFLRRLVDNKCDFAVIEVTSEGIKQKRNLFINFDVAVVTNITPEHTEAHGGFENYRKCKRELFYNIAKYSNKEIQKTLVINADDPNCTDFDKGKADIIFRYGTSNYADLKLVEGSASLQECRIKILFKGNIYELSAPAGGPFIISNLMSAISAALSLHISIDQCIKSAQSLKNPPGRFEVIKKKPFVIVDYAHTVAAVEKVLSFIKENWSGSIIHVFGAAGGGRDKWKRPLLAKLSEKYADYSILSEENSFDEPTFEILEQIKSGFTHLDRVETVIKREDAVEKAIQISKKYHNPMIIFTAKGSETVIAGPNGGKRPYNEASYIQCVLDKNYTK